MSTCDALVRDASTGVAASLRAVDCVSNEATAGAFTRLFGAHGALLPALTVLLTLYVGLFAVLLLTGRARLSIGSLTPRMVMLGLVLTFVTSSVAYQGVVWNLAVGAPDQIAGTLLGAKGSATQLFADRIDILFNAIADTASTAVQPGAPRAGSGFNAESLMWLGALLLMLGTVGVLVTARIALAVLLAVGPVFIVMVLFNGSRGLFAGWVRAVTLTALTPLFAVLCGALMTELAAPVVLALRGEEGIDGRAAMALFVIAAVHCALMSLALRVAATMVSGWQVFGLAGDRERSGASTAALAPMNSSAPAFSTSASASPRVRSMVSSLSPGATAASSSASPASASAHMPRNILLPPTAPSGGSRASERPRTRGIGSRFSSPASSARKRLV
ncbi:type IV secretion system protein [Phenylobacterium deserti]|uniref:Type VI secretion protein n=1 Tax=Phenylobacterium deserti TaxID=1914756 RepID=A0A328ACP0_9CAUL|nr:type IV secretion system protein [Phenylobacterium deserti]RAK52421.1 type VI secretion protein [Phenylobacterium deserti]